MKLVIGIGNPGTKYSETRHNIGYMVIDKFLKDNNLELKLESKFDAYFGKFVFDERSFILLKPTTYVNLSGVALKKVVNFFKINLSDILIISDDINLPIGHLRIREKGTDGGHNGLKSIIKELNSSDFKRLRIGIGNDVKIPLDKYVLETISLSEKKLFSEVFNKTTDIIDKFISGYPFLDIMSIYNKKASLKDCD